MPRHGCKYEYKIVPAPEKASKIRGLKGPARFAATLEEVMNRLGAQGWSYLRADTLPVEERAGLTSRRTVYRNLLVFQREIHEAPPDPAPTPVLSRHVTEPEPELEAEFEPDLETDLEPEPEAGSLAKMFTPAEPVETAPDVDGDFDDKPKT